MRAETHVRERDRALILLLITLVLRWFDTAEHQQKYTDIRTERICVWTWDGLTSFHRRKPETRL